MSGKPFHSLAVRALGVGVALVVAAGSTVPAAAASGPVVAAPRQAVRSAVVHAPPFPNPVPVPGASGLAVDSAGTTAYVISPGYAGPGVNGSLSVVDTVAQRVVAKIPLGSAPTDVVLDEARHRAYVSNAGSTVDGSGVALWVVDLTTNRVAAVWDVDAGDRLALSPDGSTLWALSGYFDLGPGYVTSIDLTHNGAQGAAVGVGVEPVSLAFIPDGAKLYVSNDGDNGATLGSISVIDPVTHRVTGTTPDADRFGGQLLVNPDGTRLLVDSSYDGTLTTLNTATDTVVGSSVAMPGRLAFDRAGHLYQAVDATYRVRDGVTYAPVGPVQAAPGTVADFAVNAAGTRMDLLTSVAGHASLAVVDPRQAIVRSTLPARIVVGAASTTLSFTAALSQPAATSTVALVTPATGRQVAATTVAAGSAGSLSGSVTFTSRDITAWGRQNWTLYTGTSATIAVQGTDMRARSLLGLAATRHGDLVTIAGAAKAFNSVRDTYGAWSGRPVLLQRWTSTGWATLDTLTTDRLGHVATTRRIPFTVGLRLVTADTATIWGAATAQTVV